MLHGVDCLCFMVSIVLHDVVDVAVVAIVAVAAVIAAVVVTLAVSIGCWC